APSEKMGRDCTRLSIQVKTILALETSCDETAVAILRGRELLASEIASQIAEHEKHGGIVPEIASRNHLVHAPRLLEGATRKAKIEMKNVDACAATSGPGLASSLMIGASIAKGLATGIRKPYLAINHLEGHLLSPFFGDRDVNPNVSLFVSGGHTMLLRVHGLADYQLIGRTVDDAAGEAFDKVTKMIAAALKSDVDLVTLSGGVSCNGELRRQLSNACARHGCEFKCAETWLCTDNAAMFAFAALLRLQAGFESKVTEEIEPNLALA